MIYGADQLTFVGGSFVPLCRSLHKGTYAEDPVMYRCWYQATVWRVNAGGWTWAASV